MPAAKPQFSGAKLAALRNERGLGMAELCRSVRPDLSPDTLRRWERDQAVPRYDDVCGLAHALGVDPGYFAAPREPADEEPDRARPRLALVGAR